MTVNEYLEQVRRREQAATKGPIKYGARRDGSMWLSVGDPVAGPHIQADWEFDENNAAFFAHARADVPKLLEMVEVALVELTAAARFGSPQATSTLRQMERIAAEGEE